MQKILAEMALYFGIVFCVGFLLGPIRVLWLEPRLGALLAVVLEMPLLLTAMAVAARWSPRKAGMDLGIGPLMAMGVGALALVLAADFSIGTWLRGLTVSQQIRQFSTPAGLLYAASLAAFAAMPLLVNRARRDG